jgi:predicted RNA-binding Zn ribbon-like protein
MATPVSPVATMKLVGGDPSLDFVNTVGGRLADRGGRPRVRADKLGAFSDLVTFGVRTGLMDEKAGRGLIRRGGRRPQEAAAALGRAVKFREALYRTLQARRRGRPPAAADIAVLNGEIAAARSREVLAAGREGLRWEWRGAGERLESPIWPIALAAAALLLSPRFARLRECGGDDCGWLFLDESRNHSRQWCSMEDCGNLSKVRRFRQRRARRARASPASS